MTSRGAYYRAYLARPGPQNLGAVEWPQPKRGALLGQRFLLTGIMETIEREDLQDIISECGGSFMTVVSKKLTYLIVGRDAGPVKLQKATDNEIPMIDEGGFFQYLTDTVNNFDEDAVKDVKPSLTELNDKKPGKKQPIKRATKAVKEEENTTPKTRKTRAKKNVKEEDEPSVKLEEGNGDVKVKIEKGAAKVKKEKKPIELNARGRPRRAAARRSAPVVDSDDDAELNGEVSEDDYVPDD